MLRTYETKWDQYLHTSTNWCGKKLLTNAYFIYYQKYKQYRGQILCPKVEAPV